MDDTHSHYWRTLWTPRPFRRALVASLAVHVALGVAVAQSMRKPPNPPPKPVTWEVAFITPLTPDPEEEAEVVEPPRPEPEPEPESKAEPEPKPPPKVEKETEPTPVPKPEPKPKPKPKPKAEPKPKPKQPPKPEPEVKKPEPKKTGIRIKQELPSILNSWGRLVQRKVEKYWVVPGGIRIDEANADALISFWVDHDGNLLGRPEIVKHAADAALGQSGVRAILAAAPLPPLPVEYEEAEQQVVYAFSLVK